MKHTLILLAALLCGAAQAEVIASSPSKAGGRILLTDSKGNCEKGRLVLLTTKTGEYMTGCWQPYDDQVFVIYADGDSQLYPMEAFSVRQPSAAPQKQRGQQQSL
jgi:hypothetical protein